MLKNYSLMTAVTELGESRSKPLAQAKRPRGSEKD